MKQQRIGLLGAGNMAEALLRGLLGAGRATKDELAVSDVRRERLDALEAQYGVATHTQNQDLALWADILVLAIKPQVTRSVLAEIAPQIAPQKLVVSIAAGITLGTLEELLPTGTRVVRAMPNTPATVLAGATGVARGTHATEDDLEAACSIFESVGVVSVVDERLLDAVTGLSGSGPAYVMLVIEALADGGVSAGLPRDVALRLAAQTVLGGAKLQLETGEHPARLRDMVTSPAGTTAAGLGVLESGAVRGTFISAVRAAASRAAELGRSNTGPDRR
jgi:pyrroline-5-carboxylate reductase